MNTSKNITFEKKNKVYRKKGDISDLEQIYYELKNAIIKNNSFISLSCEYGVDHDKIIKRINQNRYEIYGIIERLIQVGGTTQTNELAIRFIRDDLKCHYKQKYNNNHYNKRIDANKMIKKLKADANL